MDNREQVLQLLNEAKKVIFGQDGLLNSIISGLICEGHILIEGMPGLGKTLSVSTMSTLCDLSFKRIQFTPDLLPSDLIGTMIYSQETGEFTTKFGPIFTQILLADEINRSPAKVQAALLESMAERQVTIGEKTYKLSSPFIVLATQNPVDQEGTYSLPEAQLDRFMIKVNVDYPTYEAEKSILTLNSNPTSSLSPIFSVDNINDIKQAINEIYIDDKISDFIVRIVQATRPSSKNFPKEFKGAVLAGASPRASIWLYKLSRFEAFIDGKDYVTPDHILKIASNVLGHRIIRTYEAIVDEISSKSIVNKIVEQTI